MGFRTAVDQVTEQGGYTKGFLENVAIEELPLDPSATNLSRKRGYIGECEEAVSLRLDSKSRMI